MLEQPNGRSEVRYYLMNAAKPPLDDLNARKAVAMAIDREQINEIRNNGAYRIADGPFDTQGHRVHEEPRLPEVQPQAGEEAGVRVQGGARR